LINTRQGDLMEFMTKGSTKDLVTRGMLDEAVDSILNGMNNMAMDLGTRIDGVDAKLTQTRNELKDEINGLKADLADTPTRREFNKLKESVNKNFSSLS